MDRTKLNRRFHALLNELGMMDRKDDILSGYGIESSRELTDFQMTELIDSLEDEKRSRSESSIKHHRSVVLRLLTDIGVYYVNPHEGKYTTWERVNAFLNSPKIAGKELYKMNEQELQILERKLRTMKFNGYYYKRSALQDFAEGVSAEQYKRSAKQPAINLYVDISTASTASTGKSN